VILPCLLSFQTFGQDSLQLVPVPRWQISRAIHEVKLGRACDSLQMALREELALAFRVEKFADSLLTAKDRQIELGEAQLKTSEFRRVNQVAWSQELKKEKNLYEFTTYTAGAYLGCKSHKLPTDHAPVTCPLISVSE